MPRANRRRRDEVPIDPVRALAGATRRDAYAGGEWFVRHVAGTAAPRAYRCPGCQQEVAPGIPHVVAWPAEGVGGVGDRRHWHSGCWANRERRPPRGSFR